MFNRSSSAAPPVCNAHNPTYNNCGKLAKKKSKFRQTIPYNRLKPSSLLNFTTLANIYQDMQRVQIEVIKETSFTCFKTCLSNKLSNLILFTGQQNFLYELAHTIHLRNQCNTKKLLLYHVHYCPIRCQKGGSSSLRLVFTLGVFTNCTIGVKIYETQI